MNDKKLAKLSSVGLLFLLDEWPSPRFENIDEAAAFIAKVSNVTLNEVERLTEVATWDDQAAKRVLRGAIKQLRLE